ncbi:GrpE protein [Candidatus Sulfopaludibacter sp. SbA6]|nr:GrpE protein [Candidatus Sulfopaludibacter sp. SbA6]
MSEPLTRDEILRCLEQWVDRTLAAEDPPHGIDPQVLSALTDGSNEAAAQAARRSDTYALWSAMTALAQEVKLQGRAFKELSDTLPEQAARSVEELRAAHRERERDLEREAERRCRKDALATLIDMRDRLARGLESVRQAPSPVSSGWLNRILRRPAEPDPTIEALTKGYELALERLDQALADSNAREIQCAGLAFDPRCMNAIDREESDAVPEGTVLEVYRTGYEWNGEVFRPAQVKVSCAPPMEKAITGNEEEEYE